MRQEAACDPRSLCPQTQKLPGPPLFTVRLWQKPPPLPVTWVSGCAGPIQPGGCTPDLRVPRHCLKGSGPEPPSNASPRPPGPQHLFLISVFTVLVVAFLDGGNRPAETGSGYSLPRGTEINAAPPPPPPHTHTLSVPASPLGTVL